jgi:hypothetical protein
MVWQKKRRCNSYEWSYWRRESHPSRPCCSLQHAWHHCRRVKLHIAARTLSSNFQHYNHVEFALRSTKRSDWSILSVLYHRVSWSLAGVCSRSRCSTVHKFAVAVWFSRETRKVFKWLTVHVHKCDKTPYSRRYMQRICLVYACITSWNDVFLWRRSWHSLSV